MSEWKMYHNPKCSKSRKALTFLEEQNIIPEIIEYLKTPPTKNEIIQIIYSSDQSPDSFLRKKETDFIHFQNIDISIPEEVAKIIVKNPKLMERPIVIKGDKAVIARPFNLIEMLIRI